MSKNYFRLDFPLGYNAWRGVLGRAEKPEPDTLHDYHVFVVSHWGGDYGRAAAWAVLMADGLAVSE